MIHTILKLIGVAVLLSICSCNQVYTEPAPDIKGVSVDYDIHRIDHMLSAKNETALKDSLAKVQRSYPTFHSIFFNNVLPIQGKSDEEMVSNLYGFLTDDFVQKLRDTTQLIYGNFDDVQDELTKAFRYMKYYFPEWSAPDIYTFISEFSHQLFLFEEGSNDAVGMGLDMFLGASYPYELMAKENPAFSNYLSRTFDKKYIPRKVMYLIIDDMVGPPQGNKLIDHMIHNGKKLYMLDKVLPKEADSIIMEYTAEEMSWVQENELGIWAFFFDQDLFYESNMMKINKYINPSPDSPGMPKGAPGRTANYMGWQIIKSYMNRYPNTSIQELLTMDDAQRLLDKSKYKPKRK